MRPYQSLLKVVLFTTQALFCQPTEETLVTFCRDVLIPLATQAIKTYDALENDHNRQLVLIANINNLLQEANNAAQVITFIPIDSANPQPAIPLEHFVAVANIVKTCIETRRDLTAEDLANPSFNKLLSFYSSTPPETLSSQYAGEEEDDPVYPLIDGLMFTKTWCEYLMRTLILNTLTLHGKSPEVFGPHIIPTETWMQGQVLRPYLTTLSESGFITGADRIAFEKNILKMFVTIFSNNLWISYFKTSTLTPLQQLHACWGAATPALLQILRLNPDGLFFIDLEGNIL